MIYTVTLNASLDYVVSVPDFRIGYTNRTDSEQIFPGGKGINVSMVLKEMGMDNVALGFVAGFVGEKIKKQLEMRGCKQDFISSAEGISRINVKLKSLEGTEINGRGPDIRKEDIAKLFEKLAKLKERDILVLAGSIPASLPDSIYRDIMEYLKNRNVLFVVDATKELLVNVLEYKPFLIKPNKHELEEIFGVTITDKEQIVPYAKKLQEMGAQNVLVSLAGDGAILLDRFGAIYEADVPVGKLINGVGAGDSMVAGFLTGWITRQSYKYAFRMGVAAGSASAFSENLATKAEIQRIRDNFEIRCGNINIGLVKDRPDDFLSKEESQVD